MRLKIFFRNVLILFSVLLICCTKENTPPVAEIKVTPVRGYSTNVFTFNASGCYDNEDVPEALMVRWDWNNDLIWDTEFSHYKFDNHQFSGTGLTLINIEVMDRGGLTDITNIEVNILGRNPTSTMIDPRDGREYKTVKIFDNWWFAENLKIGNFILSTDEQKNNGIIESYGYNDKPENIKILGGLYLWDEAMYYNDKISKQGICPPGWHVPSLEDWKLILMDAPDAFIVNYYGEGGISNFNLEYSGGFTEINSYEVTFFSQLNRNGCFWTSYMKETWAHHWDPPLHAINHYFFSLSKYSNGAGFGVTGISNTIPPEIRLQYNACSIRCVKDSIL